MSESIPIDLRRAAIALAEELDYARAADRLHLTAAELRTRISALETQLCLYIFKPQQEAVELMREGRFLIRAFKGSLGWYEGNLDFERSESACQIQSKP